MTLLTNADTAMYRAKDQGRNTFCFYSAEMTQAARDHLNLKVALRQAIERREFVLHFQPQLDIASGRVVALEVLLRWMRPGAGLMPPDSFIPFAERTGLIVPIGDWVLHTACTQARHWMDCGLPPLRIAVNMSARQFMNQEMVARVRAILEDTGMPPGLLELEITEGAIMEKGGEAIAVLSELKALGIRIAIDDFGTGYSSLAYLRHFPIDVLKIDKSFMADIPQDHGSIQIALAIIAMAHHLRMDVVAEGVERADQLAFLEGQGCDISQGYLHSRPLPVAEIEALLRKGAMPG